MKKFLRLMCLVLSVLFVLSPVGQIVGAETAPLVDFKSGADTVQLQALSGNVLPGDLNGDGVYNVRDSLLLKKLLAGSPINTVDGADDVNGDGMVNTKDAMALKRFLAGVTGAQLNSASVSVAYSEEDTAAKLTARYPEPKASIDTETVDPQSFPYAVFSYILPETDNSAFTISFGSYAVAPTLIADGVCHSVLISLDGAEVFEDALLELELDAGESIFVDSLIFASTRSEASKIMSEREKGAVPAVRHEIIFDSQASLETLTAINNTNAVYSAEQNALSLTVTGGDPQAPVDYTGKGVSADECKYIILTYMVPQGVSSSASTTELFLCAGDITVPTANYSVTFDPVKDGAYHSLIIPLTEVAYWQGDVYMVRVDYFSNCAVNDIMYVDSLCMASTKAEATAIAKERMATRGSASSGTAFDGKLKINGTDTAVTFYDASSVTEDGTYTFAGQMTAVISSKAEAFNRFTFEYSTNTIVRGVAYYMVDGAEKADEFFLENTGGAVKEFSSLILGYFEGKYADRITMIEFYTIKSASASVKISAITGERFTEYTQGTYFLENGNYKLGVDLLMGGGVNYLEYFNDGNDAYGNLLNNYDVGRLIQQSYYGIDKEPYPMGYWTDGAWGYNPVQGGDKLNNISRIIDFEFISDDQFYVKARPMDWGQVNMATPSYMENVYTLTEDYVHVYNRFVDFSIYTHTVGWQELPAFYTISALNNFTYYNGSHPWTNDTLINRDDLIFWGQTSSQAFELLPTSEFWSAWVDDSGFGIGLYVPGVYTYHAGKFMYDGSADPTAASTNYVAPRRYLTLISGKPLEYSYIFSAGTLGEIRENFRVNRDLVDNTALENYNN